MSGLAGLQRIARGVAVAGGILISAAALLVCTSVIGRWLFNAPIDGDFELVKMATALTIFSFLPLTQIGRGNIIVDTFTTGLSPRWRARVDGFWDIAYGSFMAFVSIALIFGTIDAFRSGETTMQRQIVIWPSIGLATLLCMLLAVTAIGTGVVLLRSGRSGQAP